MMRSPSGHLRLAYKPHSVQQVVLPVQSSLWAVRRRAAHCSLPGAGLSHKRERHIWRRAVSHRPRTISPLLGLAPGGGYLAIRITADAGGLLHHLFTITTPTLPPPNPMDLEEVPNGRRGWLFVSVALFRQVHASRRFPRPGCYPTPCSKECGLSSIPSTQDRDCPTSLRRFYDTRMIRSRQHPNGGHLGKRH